MSDSPKDVCNHEGAVVVDGAAVVMTRESYAASIGYNPDGKPMSVVARFDQGEWWRTRDGRWLRIAEMSAGHRYNAAAMLMRGAPLHAFRYAGGFAGEVAAHDGGEMAHDSLERLLDAVNNQAVNDPGGWLRSTALYTALTAGLTVQGDGTRPWQAEGRDPVTGEPCEVPPRLVPVCPLDDCGCSGEAHP